MWYSEMTIYFWMQLGIDKFSSAVTGYLSYLRVPKDSVITRGFAFFQGMLCYLALDYGLCAFTLLTYEKSITVWRSLYFCGHALAILSLVIFSVVRLPRPPKQSNGDGVVAGNGRAATGPESNGKSGKRSGTNQTHKHE
jgi:hypothetical protein